MKEPQKQKKNREIKFMKFTTCQFHLYLRTLRITIIRIGIKNVCLILLTYIYFLHFDELFYRNTGVRTYYVVSIHPRFSAKHT